MCARGAKSPLAPTDPFEGISGRYPLFKIKTNLFNNSKEIPLNPLEREIIFIKIMVQTTSSSTGLPRPTECDSNKFFWSLINWVLGIFTWLNFPNPVFIP